MTVLRLRPRPPICQRRIVDRLTPSYSSYHFSDDVDDKGLHFDYRIRPGKATTTNAIRLLDYLGYPKEIVEKARTKALDTKANPRIPS